MIFPSFSKSNVFHLLHILITVSLHVTCSDIGSEQKTLYIAGYITTAEVKMGGKFAHTKIDVLFFQELHFEENKAEDAIFPWDLKSVYFWSTSMDAFTDEECKKQFIESKTPLLDSMMSLNMRSEPKVKGQPSNWSEKKFNLSPITSTQTEEREANTRWNIRVPFNNGDFDRTPPMVWDEGMGWLNPHVYCPILEISGDCKENAFDKNKISQVFHWTKIDLSKWDKERKIYLAGNIDKNYEAKKKSHKTIKNISYRVSTLGILDKEQIVQIKSKWFGIEPQIDRNLEDEEDEEILDDETLKSLRKDIDQMKHLVDEKEEEYKNSLIEQRKTVETLKQTIQNVVLIDEESITSINERIGKIKPIFDQAQEVDLTSLNWLLDKMVILENAFILAERWGISSVEDFGEKLEELASETGHLDEDAEEMVRSLINDFGEIKNYLENEKFRFNFSPDLKNEFESMQIFVSYFKQFDKDYLNDLQLKVNELELNVNENRTEYSRILADLVEGLQNIEEEFLKKSEDTNTKQRKLLKENIDLIELQWKNKDERPNKSFVDKIKNPLSLIDDLLKKRDEGMNGMITKTNGLVQGIEQRFTPVKAVSQDKWVSSVNEINSLGNFLNESSFKFDSMAEMKLKLRQAFDFVEKMEKECRVSIGELGQKIKQIAKLMPQEDRPSEHEKDSQIPNQTLEDLFPILDPNVFGQSPFTTNDDESQNKDPKLTPVSVSPDQADPPTTTTTTVPPGTTPPPIGTPPQNPKGKKMNPWYYVLIFGGSALLLIGIIVVVFMVRRKKGVVSNVDA